MSGTEVRGIGERHLWRQHVTNGLDLITEELTTGNIEAVELGLGRDAHVVGIVIEETRHRIGHLLLSLTIPRFLLLPEDGIAIEIDGGCEADVIKGREAGGNRNGVRHTVAPILRQAGVHQLVFLHVDRIGQTTRIAHRDLLIPPLVANHLLTSEGIEVGNRDAHLRQAQ